MNFLFEQGDTLFAYLFIGAIAYYVALQVVKSFGDRKRKLSAAEIAVVIILGTGLTLLIGSNL